MGAIACGSPAVTPQQCQESAQCSAGSRCVSGTCVVNSPPAAAIALPSGSLEATRLLTFDGSGSVDPDRDDAVASHEWTFRAVVASCAPPVVVGTLSTAQVRFACPGTYEVALTVKDGMGALGFAATQFQIADYSGPPLLTLGADVAADHVCTGVPRRCTPSAPVSLSATPSDAAPAGLAFTWTVEPPAGLPLGESRRVTFTPGPDSPTPAVSIETDGQAISGDWIFRVEARDATGVVASGATRVSVRNRAPVVTAVVPVPNHAFDGTQFLASGEVPFTVADPDGDDIVGRSVEWRHAGDGGAAFGGVLNAAQGKVTFTVQVPFGAPSDARFLIGGPGLERTIVFTVEDVNGSVVTRDWPIVIGNRPPALAVALGSSTVDHTYNSIAVAYEAAPSLSTWVDPDGDPLEQVPSSSTGDPACPTFAVSPAGTAVAHCSAAFRTPVDLFFFLGAHTVSQRVRDPWAEAGSSSVVQFTIANRPPAVITTAPFVYGHACTTTGCCDFVPGEGCRLDRSTSPAGSATVSSRWTDPDGDPLEIRSTSGATVTPVQPITCTPAACALRLDFTALPDICGSVTETLSVTITDGVQVASGALPVKRQCPIL